MTNEHGFRIMVSGKRPKIFVNMIGQYENIGDIILRRPLLNWIRPVGELHVYLGRCPDGYSKALGLTGDDIEYRSFAKWFTAACKSGIVGNAHYVFKPGEIQLTLLGLKEHIAVLPMLILMRLRGGRVIRVGSGARNFALLPKVLLLPSIALSDYVMWRDTKTAAYIGHGGVMPDLGFDGGDMFLRDRIEERKDILVISMRGDRQQCLTKWISGLAEYCRINNLTPCVVTQVHRDREMSQKISDMLSCRHIDWSGDEHDLHENQLVEIYRNTRVVVSDRLHVLIMAFSYGAVPIGLLAYPSDKIDRHFEAVGIPNLSIYISDASEVDLVSELTRRVNVAPMYFDRLAQARLEVENVRRVVCELLTKGADT